MYRHIARRLAVLFSAVGGLGFAPYAPGTAASAATVLAIFLLFPISWQLMLGTTIVLTLIALPIVQYATDGSGDPSWVVIDEVVGMLMASLSLFYVLPQTQNELIVRLVLAFVLFRFFDITKVAGVGMLEKLPGALGIMADDLLAGLWAALLSWVINLGLMRLF